MTIGKSNYPYNRTNFIDNCLSLNFYLKKLSKAISVSLRIKQRINERSS
jgi:hypothetical protein